MGSVDQERGPDSAALVYDVLRERVATQLAQVDALDAKASSLLGFAGLLLGLVFANSDITAHWNGWMTAAVVLLVVSAAALAKSLWVRDWMVKPAARDLRTWTTKHPAQMQRLLAAAFEAAWQHNNTHAARKARWIRGGTSLLATAIVIAAVGLLVARAHQHSTDAHQRSSAPAAKSMFDE